MIDKLERFLDLKADFVEVRASSSCSEHVAAKNSKIESAVSGSLSQYSVRVLDKGAFGFASTNDFRKLPLAAKQALRLARVSQTRSAGASLSPETPVKDRVEIKAKIFPRDLPLEEKASLVLELNKQMSLGKKRGLVSFDASYNDLEAKVFYLNSEGARIESRVVSAMVSFSAYAKGLAGLQAASQNYGGMMGCEALNKYWDKAAGVSEKVLRLLDAKLVKSGVYDVVIDPKMAGVLAHEAVGHACEADAVVTGESVFAGKIGEKIGSEQVSILDDATVPGAFGSFFYDDEGVAGRKKTLVETGVLKGLLHSRETAAKMGVKSTGNARAQNTGFSPIVRMSNTYFNAPKSGESFEELVNGVQKGVFVEGMRGGAVDVTTGNFQFAAESGALIEQGKLARQVRDVVIFGNILETLHKVDAVGREMGELHPGLCGKEIQSVRVADGGPHVRARGVRIGGA